MKKYSVAIFYLVLSLTITPSPLRSEAPITSVVDSLPLSSFAVPEELGKVQERFQGGSARTIVQIQDVHAHTVAQQNIAAILERLRTVFDIDKAALEGAWSSTSLPKSHAIPTSREKQLLAGTLLEDDRMSGPVYATIMSPEPITLIGIEDETSYEKNRALFLAHLKKSEAIQEKLGVYAASLKKLQNTTWAPSLLTFGNAFGKFRETSDLGIFFPILLKTAESESVNTSDLTQIILVRDIMALEKSFVKERLEKEVKQAIKKYKNRPWTIEELVRGGKIPAGEIGLYPEIKKLTHLYKLRDQISLGDLTAQIETLTGRILGKLALSPEENALWDKTERFYLAKRLLLLQASPSDIKALENEKTVLESELAGAGLADALALSNDFYALVKKRDEIFFDKIVSDPSLTGNIAVVTGGFHTDGLSQLFRDAGISYITITPELGGTAMNEKIYNERMAEGGGRRAENQAPSSIHHPISSAQSATLSELRNAIAWVDGRFLEALKVLFQTKDVRKAVKVFEGERVEVSRSDKITRLAAQGRLRKNAGSDFVTPDFREQEFMEMPRAEQLKAMRLWIEQAGKSEQKALAVVAQSGVLKIQGQLAKAGPSELLDRTLTSGDSFAVLQDTETIPEILLGKRSIRLFPVKTVPELLALKRFQPLQKSHPQFVVIQDGYRGDFVALPEEPASLLLYRILALNRSLYQAALNPAFLALLQELVVEILSQELAGKSV